MMRRYNHNPVLELMPKGHNMGCVASCTIAKPCSCMCWQKAVQCIKEEKNSKNC